MSASLLEKYTAIALSRGKSFLSKEEELRDVLLWQNQRDEKALERLIIDKALLVWSKTRDLRLAFTPIVSTSDTDQWAVEGIQKGVEAYPADKPDASLKTYVLNAARWNILHEVRPYLRPDMKALYTAANLPRDSKVLTNDQLHAVDYETYKERSLRDNFSDSLDNFPGTIFPEPYKALEDKRIKMDIDTLLGKLRPNERAIVRLRYGLGLTDLLSPNQSQLAGAFMTHSEIGDLFHVTGSRIGQIETKTLRKMQDPSFNENLSIYHEDDLVSAPDFFELEEPETEAEEGVYNPFEGLFDAADAPDPDVG